jgi:uncharacterized protein (DUF4415 family)
MNNRPNRPTGTREAAEAAFKKATAKAPPLPEERRTAIPGVKEQVTLRIDREILDYFQADGPGWQDRIVEALRKAAGK